MLFTAQKRLHAWWVCYTGVCTVHVLVRDPVEDGWTFWAERSRHLRSVSATGRPPPPWASSAACWSYTIHTAVAFALTNSLAFATRDTTFNHKKGLWTSCMCSCGVRHLNHLWYITGPFGDESFQAIKCAGIDNSQQPENTYLQSETEFIVPLDLTKRSRTHSLPFRFFVLNNTVQVVHIHVPLSAM